MVAPCQERVSRLVLLEPLKIFLQKCVIHVVITYTAQPHQNIVHILQVLVLSEPMLTVTMRVAPVVLLKPLLTAITERVSRLVLLECLLTALAGRVLPVLVTHTV